MPGGLSLASCGVRQDAADNDALISLLDHIATELAIEYVRVMERAAEHEVERGGSTLGPFDEGGDR